MGETSSTNIVVLSIVCPIMAAIFFLVVAILVNIVMAMRRASTSSSSVSPLGKDDPDARQQQVGVGDFKKSPMNSGGSERQQMLQANALYNKSPADYHMNTKPIGGNLMQPGRQSIPNLANSQKPTGGAGNMFYRGY